MLVASVIQVVTSVLAAFSVNYIMFIFFRFLVAFSVSGVFECGFVLGEISRNNRSDQTD
jgi:predicted MFS family arabinose efflux permease